LLQRKTRITHPHIDENPELGEPESVGDPIGAVSTEGSAISELYKKEKPLGHQLREGETVVYEETFIPEVDRD